MYRLVLIAHRSTMQTTEMMTPTTTTAMTTSTTLDDSGKQMFPLLIRSMCEIQALIYVTRVTCCSASLTFKTKTKRCGAVYCIPLNQKLLDTIGSLIIAYTTLLVGEKLTRVAHKYHQSMIECSESLSLSHTFTQPTSQHHHRMLALG